MLRLMILAAIFAAFGPAFAEPLGRELPPQDHPESIFTDANGCVFVRTELGGWTIWVQRLNASGQPDCKGARVLQHAAPAVSV